MTVRGDPRRNPILHRAAKLQRERASKGEQRALVCLGCVTAVDFVFGGVHSDRPCARCKKEPLGDGAVVGPSPWAGGVQVR